jgi:hypothetical protein
MKQTKILAKPFSPQTPQSSSLFMVILSFIADTPDTTGIKNFFLYAFVELSKIANERHLLYHHLPCFIV